MRKLANNCVDSSLQDQYIRFHKSILDGVEIKRCKGSPYDYKAHVHNELSLGYILTGSTELSLSDRTIHFVAGDGVMIPPMMSHRCAPNDIHDWEYVMLFIQPSYYESAIRFHQARKLEGFETGKLKNFITQLLTEKGTDTLETILIEILLEFDDQTVPDTADANAEKITQIHDYIAQHLHESITLDQLQQVSGLNKFTLIRNFKKTYVTTPAAFHLQCRVAQAKRLLNRNSDVFTICSEMNFYDQAHFIREFKKMYGITPAAYMQQLK